MTATIETLNVLQAQIDALQGQLEAGLRELLSSYTAEPDSMGVVYDDDDHCICFISPDSEETIAAYALPRSEAEAIAAEFDL